MSYNHNSFMSHNTAITTTEIDDVTYRLKVAENKLKDTLFIMPTTSVYDFDDIIDVLPLFQMYTAGSVQFDNQKYIGGTMKAHLKINLKYKWEGAEYPPRYSVRIKKNNEVICDIYKGIDDSSERMNKLYEDVLIDLNNGDQLSIPLLKDQIETHDTITFINNSYISMGVV